jgi:hypothetical protein
MAVLSERSKLDSGFKESEYGKEKLLRLAKDGP